MLTKGPKGRDLEFKFDNRGDETLVSLPLHLCRLRISQSRILTRLLVLAARRTRIGHLERLQPRSGRDRRLPSKLRVPREGQDELGEVGTAGEASEEEEGELDRLSVARARRTDASSSFLATALLRTSSQWKR